MELSMSCSNPLFALYEVQKSGKKKIMFLSNSQYYKKPDYYKSLPNFLQLPCGKCLECRLRKSQEWATRIMLEAKDYKHNYFLTLTYDNQHLTVEDIVNKETGEITTLPILKKKHLQKFLKDLRSYYDYHYNLKDIRFFACGEYGGQTLRPHFHIILMNCPIADLKVFQKGKNPLFTSNIINSIWGNGGVMIAECNWQTAAYTARYVMKKNVKEHTDKYLNLQQEFVVMSRKPGIGKKYFDKHKEDYINYGIVSASSSHVAKSITYFDKLYSNIDNDKLSKVKELRKELAINSLKNQLSNTDLSDVDYLSVKHNQKKNSVKILHKTKI